MEGWRETHTVTQDPGPSLSQNLSQKPEGRNAGFLGGFRFKRELRSPRMYRLERRGIFLTSILPSSKREKCQQEAACDCKKRITKRGKQEENAAC